MDDVTLRAAAARLHVTPQTVRHRLARGELVGTKIAGKYGPEWRISLEDGRCALADRSRGELLAVVAWQNAVILELRLCLGQVLQDLLREADGREALASDCPAAVRDVVLNGS